MKGQTGPEIIGIILLLVFFVSIIPAINQMFSNIGETPKLREQLQNCQNSLTSIQNENDNLKRRIGELEKNVENISSDIKKCEEETKNLKFQLDQCNKSLEDCFRNITNMASEINRLSN
jgi:peptidoglycan hydrolase CwlO-like protein